MSSSTPRPLALIRDRCYTATVVERWNPFARVCQDLFGFVDVLAVGHRHTVAVQTTSYLNMSSRVRKIYDSAALPVLMAAGWQVAIHGWRKCGRRWTVCEIDITAATHDH